MSYYVHSIPGRLRIQTSKLRHAQCQVDELCSEFAALDGVETYKFNDKTGSLLIQYNDKKLTAQDILYRMHLNGCLDSSVATPSHGSVSRLSSTVGGAIFGTLVKKSLETSVASLAKVLI